MTIAEKFEKRLAKAYGTPSEEHIMNEMFDAAVSSEDHDGGGQTRTFADGSTHYNG